MLAQIPDGDLNNDDQLDAADFFLMQRIIDGDIPTTQQDLDRGDIAPLENSPENPPDINPDDAVLLLRGIQGEDLDGDGLSTEEEFSAGASPFSNSG